MKRIMCMALVFFLTCIFLSEYTQVIISEESEPNKRLESFAEKVLNSQLGYDIWVIPDTGGVYTRVTNLPDTDEYNPCWSPDGTKIGHDVLGEGFHDIYITDLATGVSTFFCVGNNCSFSPDGSLIAVSGGGPKPGIWIFPAEGGMEWSLEGVSEGCNPSWSPDGSMIVYATGGTPLPPSDIYTVSSSGGTPTQLTFDPASDWDPDWSPDGNWICFVSERSGNSDIWKIQIRSDGSPIGNPIQITTDPADDGRPAWSPDGMRIVFASTRTGLCHIWTISHTGGTAQQVTIRAIL